MSEKSGKSKMMNNAVSKLVPNSSSDEVDGISEIMSMHHEIVHYAASSSAPKEAKEPPFLADRKAALVLRLEQELTQAQICNHRLNQQLKTLANDNDRAIKVELSNTKKQLKDRVSDVEELKKIVEKLKTERTMWLSKQPTDVNALMAEKQELRKQLDREQNEKQELFMQINSMIAKLADSGDQEEINRLKSDVNNLKRELESERTSSRTECTKLQAELQKTKNEMADLFKNGDKEKEAMEQEIENLQAQLAIKAASLQSLMLAKSNSIESEKLCDENESLKHKIKSLQTELAIVMREVGNKNTEIFQLRDAVSMNNMSRENMDSLEGKITELNSMLNEEQQHKHQLQAHAETLTTALFTSEDTLSKLKEKLVQFEESATFLKKENENLKQSQKEATLIDGSRIKELTQMLNDEKDNNAILNVQLREKDGKIDRIKVDLLAIESRARQAEEEVKGTRKQILNAEKDEGINQQVLFLKEEAAIAEKHATSLTEAIRKKDLELIELSSVLDETRMKMQTIIENREEERATDRKIIDDMNSQSSNLLSELQSQKKKIHELTEEKKMLESKTSVADEISTLMSSLNSVREENSQYEEELRSLQSELRTLREELYQHQDKAAHWRERAATAEDNAKSSYIRVRDLESTYHGDVERLEEEKKQLETRLETSCLETVNASKTASDLVSAMKREMTETTINCERQIRELSEKVESLTRELDTSRRRMEHLQDDQCKLIGSQDEMKTTMVKELNEVHEQVEQKVEEIMQLKENNRELEDKCAEYITSLKHSKAELEKSDEKLEELRSQLKAAEDLSERLREAQILSGNVESMFSDLQKESKTNIEKIMRDHRLETEELREQLKKSERENVSLESVIEEHQQELIKQRKECEMLLDQSQKTHESQSNLNTLKEKLHESANCNANLEEKLRKYTLESEENTGIIEGLNLRLREISYSNTKLIDSFEEQTSSLELVKKKLGEIELEKRDLENEIVTLKSEVAATKNTTEVNELTAENVRLAGELLKFHSVSEKTLQQEKERLSKQFEERLKNANLEKTRLAAELQIADNKKKTLENQIEDLQTQIDNSEKRRRADIRQLDYLREELHQSKNDSEKTKSATPIAPPRSSTRTISNMSSMTNWTQVDFSDCEDLTKLRTEIDKQKRLIIVLRRKLQGLQQ